MFAGLSICLSVCPSGQLASVTMKLLVLVSFKQICRTIIFWSCTFKYQSILDNADTSKLYQYSCELKFEI